LSIARRSCSTLILLLAVLALVGLPAAAQAAGAVYVTDYGLNGVSQYSIGADGTLSPLSPPTVFATLFPVAAAVSPDGRSAYVSDDGGAVDQYDIDPVTGVLAAKSPLYVFASQTTRFVVVTPDGKSAYAPNANFNGTPPGAGTVSQYDIDPVTGALTPKSPPSVPAGLFAMGIGVTPDGKSAYVANEGSFTVSQYEIDPVTGALSPKAPATAPSGSRPEGIAISPDGKSAYVTNTSFGGPGTVSQYDVDPVTGELSPKSPATVGTGSSPSRVAVTSDGTSAYVTNLNSDTVSQYDIDQVTGALSPKTPSTVAAGAPVGIAIGPRPRAPTSMEQCKNGGWRDYSQFKNQGQCVAFVQQAK
jgi:DNA-binding beta-propeller fold protein YncE